MTILTATLAPQPPATGLTQFAPSSPKRLFDSRDPGNAKIGAGGAIDVQVTGLAGVPNDPAVRAVALNVTATQADGAGYLTVWPADRSRPVVASVNVERVGQSAGNQTTVKLSDTGRIKVFSSAGAHVVIDVLGYYTDADPANVNGRLIGLTPTRVADSRQGVGVPLAPLGAGGQVDIQLAGRGGVPATGVSAVIVNNTVVRPAGGGFVTMYPTGTTRPDTSSLNAAAGETRGNLSIVPLGADGKVTVYTSAGADIVVDVAGYFTSSTVAGPLAAELADTFTGLFVPIDPVRINDSRFGGAPKRPAQSTFTQQVGATRVAPPYLATGGAALNVTLTQTASAGYVTVWEGGQRPTVSSVNATRAGQTIPNAVIAPISIDTLDVYAEMETHMVVDMFGYYFAY